MQDISQIRKSYQRGALDEASASPDPLQQFAHWLQEALNAQIPEPNAMTLATVSAAGRPSTRIVLIKDFDVHGLVWFTNYDSRKGHELAGNACAALQFHWVELERMVRVEGRVKRTSAEESDRYFNSRPLESRWGAWASPQSAAIASREVLDANLAEAKRKWGDNPPRPPHWGGYRLAPDTWEFWQGRPSRLHDRLRYRLEADGKWIRERLAP